MKDKKCVKNVAGLGNSSYTKIEERTLKSIQTVKNLRTYYKGNHLLIYLITIFNKRNKLNLFCFAWTFSIYRNVFLMILVYTKGFTFLPEFEIWELLFYIFATWINIHSSKWTMVIFSLAFTDLKRKISMMIELDQMLKPEKDSSNRKVLPTINVLEKASLLSWRKMRLATRDYGKKFFTRHNLFYPCLLIAMALLLGFLFAIKFEFFVMQEHLSKALQLLVFQDFFTFGALVLILLYLGAGVNSFYEKHIFSLKNLHCLVSELLDYQNHFFPKSYDLAAGGGHNTSFAGSEAGRNKYCFAIKRIQHKFVFDKDLTDPLLARLAQELEKLVAMDEIENYLEELLEVYEKIINDLQHEEETGKLSIIGLKIDKKIFWNMLVGLFTLAYASYQFLVTEESDFLKK